MVKPSFWITAATFSDRSVVNFERADITVIVGANNSGKSEALRNVRNKVDQQANPGTVITNLAVTAEGTHADVMAWLEKTSRKLPGNPQNPGYQRDGAQVHRNQAELWWRGYSQGLHHLSGMFCYHLTADERLTASNAAPNIAMMRDPLSHPIHYLYVNDALEESISEKFRNAFGTDLIVHRSAGNQIPLHTGLRPIPPAGKDRLSTEYVTELEKLPTLHAQGDGMRAFVGILLHTMVVEHSILLIDEPEAFLHPPQARLLGRLIGSGLPSNQQVFVATHSGDFLRGMLDVGTARIRILRLNRVDNVNHVRELNNSSIRALWSDSLLRYSNILDGLFHEKVVVGESDSDCRFYSAIKDSLPHENDRRKDVMFTHCGGKARIPMILRALVSVGVPVSAICDIDILNEEHPLKDIIEILGGDWADIRNDWNLVKSAIEQKRPDLATAGVQKEIQDVLGSVTTEYFPKNATQRIEAILKRASPWSIVKDAGRSYIPAGDASQAFERIIGYARARGLFIVEVGELEGFDRTVGGHGPRWVNAVLEKDLTSTAFDSARGFVKSAIA